MDQENFYGVEMGQGLETTTYWGQGRDLILLGHASNGRHLPDVSEACTVLWTPLVLGSMSLGYPLPPLACFHHTVWSIVFLTSFKLN